MSIRTYNSTMVPRFFCPAELHCGRAIRLPPSVAHHVDRVLRLRVGDALVLFDGRGGEYAGQIASVGEQVSVTLTQWHEIEREAKVAMTLAQALPSSDKMDWIVQKAVELGAVRIAPVVAERSVVRLEGERAAKRAAHWQQVAIAACEQCGRNRVPEVAAIQPLPAFLAEARDAAAVRLVLDPAARGIIGADHANGPVILLVGPEGGFSGGEMAAITGCGFAAVRLGPRLLRTETAGTVAMATLLARAGEI